MTSALNGAAAPHAQCREPRRDEILRVEDLKVHFPLTQGHR